MDDLKAWKDRTGRKPLLLRGARQTGKTWLVDEFARREFRDEVKIDFLLDEQARNVFEQDLDPHRIIRMVELRTGQKIDPETTLLFFDEIQEAPRGITSLKYFCELAPEYHVIAAGSYLGIALRREDESFPVGKVDMLTCHPLCFEEFLRTVAGDPLTDALHRADMSSLAALSDSLEARLKEFLAVGGMPEVVASFSCGGDFFEARRLQRQIVVAYNDDFSKHAPARLLERMRLVWRSLPGQLARENKKFLYGTVRKGARARDFEECIQWLVDYGAVLKVPRATALRHPLSSYEDLSAFKLYCVDVGLLGAMADLDMRAVTRGSLLFTEFKGAMTEQYVAQELVCKGYAPAYWSAEAGTAEVDFALSKRDAIVPIEVKAGENLRSKSLRVACDKYAIGRAVRTSLAAYRDEGRLVNIPLWGIGQFDSLAMG